MCINGGLKIILKDILLTFNNKEFHFIAFDKNGNIMIDNVYTETYCIIC